MLEENLTVAWWHNATAYYKFSADGNTEAKLTITNTTPDKYCRGWMSINNKWYLVDNEDSFSKTIPLKSTNRILIMVFGAPGTRLNIKIISPGLTEPEITSFFASPETVAQGDAVTLTWTTENADTVNIEPDIGTVDTNGSVDVTPEETTTYTLTASSEMGTMSEAIMVTVSQNTAPEITITSVEQNETGNSYECLDSRYHADLQYEWFDITSLGTPVTLENNASFFVDLPFEFNFFNKTKTEILVDANGYLTFGSFASEPDNDSIPSSEDPDDLIAAFWDDLDPSLGGTVHFYHDHGENRFIVQYTGIYSDDGPNTFQIILNHDGAILFQFQDMQGNLTSATVGIENTDGTDGLQLAFNAAFIENELAVLFKPVTSGTKITWEDADPDDNAQISLFYDTDNSGIDGNLIADNISEDPDGAGDQFFWDTTQTPEGSLYVYAVIDDGTNPPATSYYNTPIIIDRHTPCFVPMPDQEGMEGELVSFMIEAQDPNDDSLIYSAANLPEGSVFDPATAKFSWTPTVGQAGTFYPTFTVSDGPYSDSLTVQITINPHAPVVSISADPLSVPPDGETLLTWASDYADTCTIEPDIGEVTTNGSTSVTLTENTTFTITATGPGGTATEEVTVSILSPEVSISADPQTIKCGGFSTLTWTSANALSCRIEPNIGSVSLSGSMQVSPQENTTYIITAATPTETATDSVDVTVMIPPQVSLSVSDDVINYGDSVTLTWSASSAHKAYLNNGIGQVAATGSMVLTPEYTTTYAITAVNSSLTAHQSISVKVLGNPPAPQPVGSFGEQYNDLIPANAGLASYDPERFVVITGIVRNIDGYPLPEVTVSIHDHPEYGTVQSDETGRYAIPAEGGGLIKISLEKQGFLTAQRKIKTSVMDVLAVDSVTLITRDPNASVISFDGNSDTVVTHQSTPVSDEFGSRSCSLIFTGDNQAYEVDRYGNVIQQLSSITVRATEYTTPESMPAKLPPTSAFTYCTELEVDGVKNVLFDKSVIGYVDNFLGFDVGVVVPVGYYDRGIAEWVASENGVVVKLLDINNDGIVDSLDMDGDDLADDMDNDGLTVDEVLGLGNSSYQPGETYWRFQTQHFSPCDLNFAYGTPDDATRPEVGLPLADSQKEELLVCKTPGGSFVDDRGRILHQDIPIYGTDLTLHFASDRVSGYKTIIDIPASNDNVPASLKEIIVKVKIAGRTIQKNLPPLPNQCAKLTWDGHDCFGRPVKKPVLAYVDVGYVYNGVYSLVAREQTMAFAMTGTYYSLVPAREEIVLWKNDIIRVGPEGVKTPGEIAQGWTFSTQHCANLNTGDTTLYKGDGTIISNSSSMITTIAGSSCAVHECTGAGGPATEARMRTLRFSTLDTQGNLYITDSGCSCVHKINTDGIITIIAGMPGFSNGYSGDGGPATEARFYGLNGIAVDGQGNIYVADSGNYRIRKIDTNGIVTTVVGNGEMGYSGDGGPATKARLGRNVYDISFDDDGNLYIAENGNGCIRKVDTEGIITTYKGGIWPRGLAVDRHGNIYYSENYRVFRIETDGATACVAGRLTSGYSGDGGPATEAEMESPFGICVDNQGNLFISNIGNYCVRKVDTSGIITTFAGGERGYNGDGGPATKAQLYRVMDVEVDALDNLYIVDNCKVRKVGLPSLFAGMLTNEKTFYADINGVGYVIDASNRHINTIDLESGKTLKTFTYGMFNNQKKLTIIKDQFNNQITINRSSDGTPFSVVSPDGLTTFLSVDSLNHLIRITLPDCGIYDFTYTAGGLLVDKTEPVSSHSYHYDYDEYGRITGTSDSYGGHWQFDRSLDQDGLVHNSVLSAENNLTAYLDETLSTGQYISTITSPDGGVTSFTQSPDGLTVQKELSCGMSLDFAYDLDPECKYRFVKQMQASTPNGLTRTVVLEKDYQDTNVDEVPDLFTQTVAVNGKATVLENNVLGAARTISSPENRSVISNYDPDTLVTTSTQIPGLNTTNYTYFTNGKLQSIASSARQTFFTYDDNGYLDSVTGPRNLTTRFVNDNAGRVVHIDRPDGTTLDFDFDENGNMTVLTNASGVSHSFSYNEVDLATSYGTPLSGDYGFVYDNDRRLTRKDFPSGQAIYWDYADPLDASDKSRLWRIRTPEYNIDYTYACGSKIKSITNGTESIIYDYDGKLITSETLAGILNQTLSYTYNNDFNLSSMTYADSTESFSYDDDGLLTGAGGFTISRYNDPGVNETGLPYNVSNGTVSLSRSFNGYGETGSENTVVNNQDVYSWNVPARYNDGKIKTKTETIGGVTITFDYTYDDMGRLLTVTKDGSLVEEYDYTSLPYGTCTYQVNTPRGIAGRSLTYDDEDHLLSAGDADYQYDLDGFLQTKITLAGITGYDYTSRGELRSVDLPDGTAIEYVHDPLGRRIAKKVNGTIVEKYLWSGLTTLLAVYDGSDNLLMRFKYAVGRMPVAVETAGVVYYLAYDQVGSLRAVADASGNIVKQIEYDSFGYVINDTNPGFAVPFGFAGGLYDKNTGLVRFGYRDYDPDTGRWTAKDPIGFAGGDSDLYGYCLNDPINFVDPYGLEGLLLSLYKKVNPVIEVIDKTLSFADYNEFHSLNNSLKNNIDAIELILNQDLNKCYNNPNPCGGCISSSYERHYELRETMVAPLLKRMNEIADKNIMVQVDLLKAVSWPSGGVN